MDIIRFLQERYGLRPHAVEPLTGGELNELWVARDPGGDVVVRRSRPETPQARIQFEHRVLATIADLDWPVAPLPGRDGETLQLLDGRAITVFPHVAGRHADPADDAQCRAVATALALLHTLTRRRFGARAPEEPGGFPDGCFWHWRHVVRERVGEMGLPVADAAKLTRLFDDEVDELEEAIGDVRAAGRLPVAVIHGDCNERNVLVDDGRITGVVDWESTRHEWCAWELAQRAFGEWSRPGGAYDPRRPPAFVRAYVDAGGPFDTADAGLLVLLARSGNVEEVMWTCYGGELHPEAGRLLRQVGHGVDWFRRQRLRL